MSRSGCGLPIGLALGAALAIVILAAAFYPGHPSTPAPALSEAGYYLLCGGPVALLLLACVLIWRGARLAGGFLAGLLLALLAGLALLAAVDVAGGLAGG